MKANGRKIAKLHYSVYMTVGLFTCCIHTYKTHSAAKINFVRLTLTAPPGYRYEIVKEYYRP